MKKRIVKGVVATTLALISVFGVPQFMNKNATFNTSITAEAATCRHAGYSHWYTYECVTYKEVPIIASFSGGVMSVPCVVGYKTYQRQYRVEHCAKCGARIDVVRTGKERVI